MVMFLELGNRCDSTGSQSPKGKQKVMVSKSNPKSIYESHFTYCPARPWLKLIHCARTSTRTSGRSIL